MRLFVMVGFVLAFYGFLFDFITPLTPTPIAVLNGKPLRHAISPAVIAGVCLLVQCLLPSFLRSAPKLFERRAGDLVNVTGCRRC